MQSDGHASGPQAPSCARPGAPFGTLYRHDPTRGTVKILTLRQSPARPNGAYFVHALCSSVWQQRCYGNGFMVHYPAKLDRFAQIGVPLEVRLGTCRMPVAQVLGLEQGVEISLDGFGADGCEVWAGNVRIGHGTLMRQHGQLVVRLEKLDICEREGAEA